MSEIGRLDHERQLLGPPLGLRLKPHRPPVGDPVLLREPGHLGVHGPGLVLAEVGPAAVEGSVLRQTSSSRVGIEKVTETFARRDASARTSTSRTIIGPRVMMLNGFDASRSASRQARVSLKRPSAGWYGSG